MAKHPWVASSVPSKVTDPYRHLYQSVRWRKARAIFLSQNPTCQECDKLGVVSVANTVDHHTPVRSGRVDFWDESNWQALCGTCHQKKRQSERGTINYTDQHGH